MTAIVSNPLIIALLFLQGAVIKSAVPSEIKSQLPLTLAFGFGLMFDSRQRFEARNGTDEALDEDCEKDMRFLHEQWQKGPPVSAK